MTASADILIIGGGVIGSSIAFNLLQDGFKGRILVIERDPSYQFASSALAMGGVRQQFMSTVNIRMVQYSLKVLEHFPESQFRQRGYLFLATESTCEKLRRRHDIQKSLGAECEMLDVSDVRRLVPELRSDDLVGGLFGPKDGYVDPRATSLVRAFHLSEEITPSRMAPGSSTRPIPAVTTTTRRRSRFNCARCSPMPASSAISSTASPSLLSGSNYSGAHCRDHGPTNFRS